jgi:hypothetical protein
MARGWTGRLGYGMSAISWISDEELPPTLLDTRTFADIKERFPTPPAGAPAVGHHRVNTTHGEEN